MPATYRRQILPWAFGLLIASLTLTPVSAHQASAVTQGEVKVSTASVVPTQREYRRGYRDGFRDGYRQGRRACR